MVEYVEQMCAQIPPDGAKDFLLHEHQVFTRYMKIKRR